MSGELSLRYDVLDRQIIDADGVPIGRIDDARLALHDGVPVVAELLTGARALGERLGGPLGRTVVRVAERLRDAAAPAGPASIDAAAIAEVGHDIRLVRRLDELPHVAALEQWLAQRVVSRIPGARRAGE